MVARVAAGPTPAARAAVAALFFVNGALFANWVPRIPDVKAALGLTDGALGLALLGAGVGGLLGSLAAGPLETRYGSHMVSTAGGVVLGAVLVLPGLTGSWLALAAALLTVGVADAVMDVAMNAHAVLVQRGYGRSIVNGFHALWSMGATVGSMAGSLAAARQVPVAVHLAGAGLVLAVVVVAAHRWLLLAPASAVATAPAEPAPGGRPARRVDRARARGLVAPTGAVGALGMIALLGALVEDAPGSWSAVYMRESLGASPGVAGLAFAAFTAAMAIARLLGDGAVERFGAIEVLRSGTLLSACGLAAGLLLDAPLAGIVGFGLVGLGVSTLFPLAFAAAGAIPGVPAGGGIGMVSLLARLGFLASPPVIGLAADAVGLSVALWIVVGSAAVIALSAGRLARRFGHSL